MSYETILVNETNTPYTSIDPYRLPLAFTLFFYLERPSSNDYEHSMYGTWHGTNLFVVLG